MSNRMTAYIAQIDKTEPIPNKNKIVYASLKDLGFKVIVGSDITPGQHVVYIEYDCVIPQTAEWAESLRSRCYSAKYNGFKIGVMKMAGLFSEGIVFKCSDVFKDKAICKWYEWDVPIGTDLSKVLDIKSIDDDYYTSNTGAPEKETKFQRFLKRRFYFVWKLFYKKNISQAFPSFAANKSDETRVQRMNYLFDENSKWKDQTVYISTKVDGQSSTFAISNNRFIIASRNFTKYNKPLKKAMRELISDKAKKYSEPFIYIAAKLNLPEKMVFYRNAYLKRFNIKNYAMQAELAGPGIQGNKLGLSDYQIFVYNIYDSENKKYFGPHLLNLLPKLGITIVPDIWFCKMNIFPTLEKLINFSKGNYANGKPREGIVVRAFEGDYLLPPESEMHGAWSFKVINPDFLLDKSNI